MLDEAGAARQTSLEWVARTARDIAALKRIHYTRARVRDSVAERLFRRAWAALTSGAQLEDVAWRIAAEALVATRLGAIDEPVLLEIGVDAARRREIAASALADAAGGLPDRMPERLLAALVAPELPQAAMPAFVERLQRQPRAGGTCPGQPRLILEPPESHADHCLAVAVLGVLLTAQWPGNAGVPFLIGLAHHLHNATLPDSGFAGELLLGRSLEPIMRSLFDREIASLPPALAQEVSAALAHAGCADPSAGAAFNAADVIDRVTETRHFANVAAFTADVALAQRQLVHAGPLQAFHHDVLQRAGLQ